MILENNIESASNQFAENNWLQRQIGLIVEWIGFLIHSKKWVVSVNVCVCVCVTNVFEKAWEISYIQTWERLIAFRENPLQELQIVRSSPNWFHSSVFSWGGSAMKSTENPSLLSKVLSLSLFFSLCRDVPVLLLLLLPSLLWPVQVLVWSSCSFSVSVDIPITVPPSSWCTSRVL